MVGREDNNIKYYFDLVKNKTSLFLIPYSLLVFYFVFKTSQTLPPFNDEIVSLSANIGFFLNSLNFEGPRETIFQGLYSPYLTSPPLSAVGSSLAWSFTDNFNIIRLSNFAWVLVVQLLLGYQVSKIYNLNYQKVVIFSTFSLIAFPFWFGSIYSLGETISIIIFFNSILLYKDFPNVSILMMGSIVFFGKIILVLLFIFFYFSNLLLNKNFRKIPKEIFIFLTPSFLWLLLILFKSEYQTVGDYADDFLIMWNYMGSQVGNLSLLDILNYSNIVNNFETSEVLSWNTSVILRVFLAPILLSAVLVIKKGKELMLEVNQLVYLFFGLAPLYGWFLLVSPEKPIIYAAHFTFPVLMFCFYLLSRKNLKKDLVNNTAFFTFSLYMTSEILFAVSLLLLILISTTKKFKYSLIVPLIVLNIFNATYEVSQDEIYIVDITKCKPDVSSNYCFEYLMSIKEN